MSLTPEGGSDADDAANGDRADADAGEQSEVFGIGANWTGDFSGTSVSVGAGYTGASVEAGGDAYDDREEWIIGLRATMDAISVGGNYSADNNGKSGSNGRTTWVLGATYGMGPMTYGVTYANTSREQGAGNIDLDSDTISFNATYALGAGLSVTAGIQFWDIEDADVGANEATVALIGTSVRF